ncbi:epididymal protein 13 isoform X14 [Tupaia chinensis]|uniref:epididymal protein 13 isoform X14 n=1 Tax=Tupaia chinensis TaxID=246437 RepID=UPI000703D76B|nr:epididymal protein 13 isoform X14 [Tupaia chinensis]
MPSDTEAGAGRACSSVAASVGRVWVPWPLGRPEGVWAARVVLAAGRSWATRALCILEGERAPTTCRSKPFLKMLLWPLLFLGLADACVPREAAIEEKSGSTDCWFCCPPVQLLKGILGMMSRLSPDDRTEEEMKILKQILEESSGCKEEEMTLAALSSSSAPSQLSLREPGPRYSHLPGKLCSLDATVEGDWVLCRTAPVCPEGCAVS